MTEKRYRRFAAIFLVMAALHGGLSIAMLASGFMLGAMFLPLAAMSALLALKNTDLARSTARRQALEDFLNSREPQEGKTP